MHKLRVILAVVLIVTLIAGCSGSWRPKRPNLASKGPVKLFLGLINQVKDIGKSLSRQIRSIGFGRH